MNEQAATKVFETMRFEGAEPITDKPLVVLGFTNRCGSNLLAEYMTSTGKFFGLGEFLNETVMANQSKQAGVTNFAEYLAMHQARADTNGKILGIKASAWQLAMMLRAGIPQMYGGGIKLINIHREDLVAQAVSRSIALQTKKWKSSQDGLEGVEVEFRSKQIMAAMTAALASNEAMSAIASIAGLDICRTTYEEVTTKPIDAIRRIGAFTGVDLERWVPPEATLMQRQSDDTNIRYAEMFRRQHIEESGFNL